MAVLVGVPPFALMHFRPESLLPKATYSKLPNLNISSVLSLLNEVQEVQVRGHK
jgi:hypothetical protein